MKMCATGRDEKNNATSWNEFLIIFYDIEITIAAVLS